MRCPACYCRTRQQKCGQSLWSSSLARAERTRRVLPGASSLIRYLIHVSGLNLGLLIRALFRVGVPKGWADPPSILSYRICRLHRLRTSGRSAKDFSTGLITGSILLYCNPFASWLTSCRLAPVTMIDNGMPLPPQGYGALLFFSSRSVGLRPELCLAKGALFMLPSMGCHSHAIPSIPSYADKPRCQSPKKTACSRSLKDQ